MRNDFVIIGSAPSLTQDEIDYCKGKARVIVVNDNYLRAPWADILYWCDKKWFIWHKDKEEFGTFKGVRATINTDTQADWYFKRGAEKGLSHELRTLNTGKNSGHQALNLACHLGAERIMLLGFDMKAGSNGQTHWFGNHPQPTSKEVYEIMLPEWETVIPDLNGVKVYNCGLNSRIECFEKRSIYELL